MPVSKSLLIDAAMILVLIAVAVLGYRYSPLLLPPVDMSAEPEPGCDLQQTSCAAVLPQGGRLRFTLMPHPIPVTEPMQVSVELEAADADRVEVDFSGVSMNMGFNRQELKKLGPGRFSGEATLPVCITGRMSWQATIMVVRGRLRTAVPFRFEVGH